LLDQLTFYKDSPKFLQPEVVCSGALMARAVFARCFYFKNVFAAAFAAAGLLELKMLIKKAPNPIDKHVGSRVRMRRVLIGMSQERLGDALGLTFQQVQKYEKGTNRIGASRLQQISRILGMPVEFFFEGSPAGDREPAGFQDASDTTYVADFLATNEGVQLNRAFLRIRDPKMRRRVVDLVNAIAGEEEVAVPPATDFDNESEMIVAMLPGDAMSA
jgi:transcriptional regulator with XRE-family HTH domain